jgi:hypothetical protein
MSLKVLDVIAAIMAKTGDTAPIKATGRILIGYICSCRRSVSEHNSYIKKPFTITYNYLSYCEQEVIPIDMVQKKSIYRYNAASSNKSMDVSATHWYRSAAP